MYPVLKKLIIVIINALLLLAYDPAFAQTEFFNSKNNFSFKQLNNFHSSFSIDSTQVYFNANDYNVYAYNKKSGVLNWSHYIANKTNTAPIPYQNSLFVSKHLSEYNDKCVQLNSITGDTIQTLSIESINTKPIFKENIMYCTGIDTETGGIALAYDFKKNALVWKKFIAHGVDKQPYYLEDKIIANAEDDNWFELEYNGKFLDTTCEQKTNLFVEDIKCVRNFKYLTHNQKEITTLNFEDFSSPKIKYSKDRTFILGESKMQIINSKNKIEKEIKLEETISNTKNKTGFYTEILKIDANSIWFIYLNTVVVYDFEKNKTIKTFDLKYNVHQAVLDGNNLWLISKNDGELVGLQLEVTKKEQDEKAARLKMEKELGCAIPDKTKIEAQRVAVEKF